MPPGKHVLGLDCESHLAVRGLNTPPMVCMTLYTAGEGVPQLSALISAAPPSGVRRVPSGEGALGVLLDVPAVRVLWPRIIRSPLWHIVGQNIVYDIGLAVDEAGCNADVFAALDDGPRISDVQIREKLSAIAHGRIDYDPRSKTVDGRYTLADLVLIRLGLDITGEKVSTPKGYRGDVWEWVCEHQACKSCELDVWLGIGHPRHHGRRCDECEGFGLSGPWRLRYAQLHGVPVLEWPAEAVDYAVLDAKYAAMVFDEQAHEQPPPGAPGPIIDPETGLFVNEWQQVEADWALALHAMWGPRTDPDAVAQTTALWQVDADKCLEIGQRLGFVRSNGSENRGEMTRLIREDYERRGLVAPRNPPTDKMLAKARGMLDEATGMAPGEWSSKTTAAWKRAKKTPDPIAAFVAEARELELGNLKYDSDTLADCASKDLREYAEGTTYRDNLNKYAHILYAGTRGPITSRPDVLKATGRTSISNPPMQQPPQKGGYRECHVPRPGWIYGHGDYDTIELAAQAQNLIDWGFGDDLASRINIPGSDLHTDLAAAHLGISFEDAMARKRAGDPIIAAERKKAKAGNFGFWGGMGASTCVKTYGVDSFVDPDDFADPVAAFAAAVEAAKELKQTFMARNPEARPFFKWASEVLEASGGSTVLAAPMSGRLRMVDRYTVACNTGFQGRVADGAKLGIYRVARECYTDTASAMYGARPWLLLHDEVLAEFPREGCEAGVRRMCEVLADAMRVLIPDVRVNIDPVLARRWFKGADPVHTKTGQLVPWEPWRVVDRWECCATWKAHAGIASRLDCIEMAPGEVEVYDGSTGDGIACFTHDDPVVARHRAECFVLGEEPLV